MYMFRGILVLVLMVSTGMGCDPAQEQFELGQEAEMEDDIKEAIEHYEDAVAAAPDSESGKRAQLRLETLEPRLEELRVQRKAKRAAREAARKAQELEEAKQKAEREAKRRKDKEARNARELKEAWKVVRLVRWGRGVRDGTCTSKGLPPYKIDFEGGTYRQNELVALSRNCKHLFGGRHNRNTILWNSYCCP